MEAWSARYLGRDILEHIKSSHRRQTRNIGDALAQRFGKRFRTKYMVCTAYMITKQVYAKFFFSEQRLTGALKDKRFLQLGLILPLEDGLSIYHQTLPCSIPFDQTHEQLAVDQTDEQLAVWDNGPPPDSWIIGTRASFVEIDACCQTREPQPFSDYSGWAPLDSLCEVTICGEMRGIKLKYHGKERDLFFGCVDGEQDVSIQTIDWTRGERVIGIAVLVEEDEVACKASVQDDDNQSIISASSHANTLGGMEHIVVSAPATFFFYVHCS
jgi:hypothetical protein